MKVSPQVIALGIAIALPTPASAQLWVDFNSNQSAGGTPVSGDATDPTNAIHHEEGYRCYHATHEDIASFVTATYDVEFSGTGTATVTMTPSWPNTTDARVRQSIGRSDGQADTWLGETPNLLRDWIGADSRTTNGGYGAWDGSTGTPTYFMLTFGGLPNADYEMIGYFHDVENMNSYFTVEISTDGGNTFGESITGRMTNSLSGGTPAENEVLPNTAPNIAGGDPVDLSSTLIFSFSATGDDVVFRFAPLATGSQVHRDFVGLNGFQLRQTTPPVPFELTITPSGSDYMLAWESKSGMLYNVRRTADPSTELSTWTLVEGDIPATPDTNTKTVPGSGLVQFYRIEEFPAPPITLLSESFDTTAAGSLPTGWTAGAYATDSGTTSWEVGPPTAVGPIPPGFPLPSGTQCIGTNIAADYTTDTDIWLRSPGTIDLAGASKATLTFQQWVDVDDFNFGDTGTVRVLAAAGLPGTVTELAVVKADIQGLAPAGWVEFSANLPSAALGQMIALEFRFTSDNDPAGDTSGWYMDDVVVTTPAR